MAYFDKSNSPITLQEWTNNNKKYKISKRYRNRDISMVVWFNGEASAKELPHERKLWSLSVQTKQERTDPFGNTTTFMDDDAELSGKFFTEQEALNVFEHLAATYGGAEFVTNKETGQSALMITDNIIKSDTPDEDGLDPAKAEEFGSW